MEGSQPLSPWPSCCLNHPTLLEALCLPQPDPVLAPTAFLYVPHALAKESHPLFPDNSQAFPEHTLFTPILLPTGILSVLQGHFQSQSLQLAFLNPASQMTFLSPLPSLSLEGSPCPVIDLHVAFSLSWCEPHGGRVVFELHISFLFPAHIQGLIQGSREIKWSRNCPYSPGAHS